MWFVIQLLLVRVPQLVVLLRFALLVVMLVVQLRRHGQLRRRVVRLHGLQDGSGSATRCAVRRIALSRVAMRARGVLHVHLVALMFVLLVLMLMLQMLVR